MGVDADRRDTAQERRRAIIAALNAGFSPDDDSPVGVFREAVRDGDQRLVVANADIDGLVSAQLLASCTNWRIATLIDRNGSVRVHPDYSNLQAVVDSGRSFGVDVFSPLFPGVSNHPVFFAPKDKTVAIVRQALVSFDDEMQAAIENHHVLNLSAWVGIGAMLGSEHPKGMPYKYPLGTAQLLLAVMESAGLNPRLYDRQFLPWLIANCDGGVDTIRTYAWNAETWWSALAAVVGPASHSEALYRMVSSQRPNEFLDMDRRLRYEDPTRAAFLNTKWNLNSTSHEALKAVTGLVSDLSGWPDPFLGGVAGVSEWPIVNPTRNVMRLRGITKLEEKTRETHLEAASMAVHVNFSMFKERGTALGWSLAGKDLQIESELGTTSDEEEIQGDEPSTPDMT